MTTLPVSHHTSSVGVGKPTLEVIDAFDAGVVRQKRRVEIYESDARTLWKPSDYETNEFKRLITGSVNVDYNSDERRTLDLVLDNRDNLLRQDPLNGFWYDKIIKVFRGIAYESSAIAPRAAIIEAPSTIDANSMKATLSGLGFDKTTIMTSATTAGELNDQSFVIAFTGTSASAKSDLLKSLWARGKHIVTIGIGSTHAQVPLYTASTGGHTAWGVAPVPTDNPAAGAFTSEAWAGTPAGVRPTALAPGSVRIAAWPDAIAPTHIAAAIASSVTGGYWLDIRLPDIVGPQAKNLLRAALNYMRNYYSEMVWEVQQGEFMIDNISEDNFPNHIKITGRDYTKKLMNSKLSQATTFVAGTSLADLVAALATNAGADPTRFNIRIGSEVLGTEMAFDRGTDRWSIIKEACNSFNYEVFFSATGGFTVRKFIDPTTAPVAWTFKTGYESDPDGANLVNYSRSTNDSRVYNHIVVYSEPSEGEERLPYFGEAKNTDPDSPTRIARLGERMHEPIQASWLSSDAECQAHALSRLRIAALESYDMSFSSIFYPWMEVGEIVEVLDPKRLDHEPTRFLLDNISYPLDLGPMSGTTKRVTFVGETGSPDEPLEE